jgi:hypothetical protein
METAMGGEREIAAAIEEVRAALRRDAREARAARKDVYMPVAIEAWLERLAKAALERARSVVSP